MLWQEGKEVEENVVAENVVVTTITKANGHTSVDAEDTEDVGDVVVKINVWNLMTKEIHPKELVGWKISSTNQGFMQNRRIDYMNYATEEAPPPLQPKT